MKAEINTVTETLRILYQDESVVAVEKPPGLLVHKSPIDKHETRYAMKILRNQIGQWVYPCHRIDKPTSGVLLFALSSEAASEIGRQFESHTVRKTYLALVRGYTPLKGKIEHPLREIAVFKNEKPFEDKEPQQALTHYERLAGYELPYSDGRFPTSRYSLIKLHPKTGRKHQIRRHLKHISHPIIGDVKYGKGTHNRLFRDDFACARLLLAATEIRFKHPKSGDDTVISGTLGEDFQALLDRLQDFQTSSE